MTGTSKEKWLAVAFTGYIAWVVPYDVRQYFSFLAPTDPGIYLLVSLLAITLICTVLVVALFLSGDVSPLKLGLSVAVPWLLISLVFDFGMETYYRGWEPNFLAFGMNRAWHFALVPIGCILAGLIIPVIWKPKVRRFVPVSTMTKFRK